MKRLVLFFSVLCLSTISFSSDTQTNFTISPPPLGYPEYKEFNVTSKLDFNISSISGNNISLFGVFVGWTPRLSSEIGALNLMIGLFNMNGKVSGNQITFSGAEMIPCFEAPIVNDETIKFIIFAGPTFSYSLASFDMYDPYYGSNVTIFIDTTLSGLIAGFQIHIFLDETLVFSPFILLKSVSGKGSIDGGSSYMNTTYDIPTTSSMTFGFDIIEKETGITLSGIIQMLNKTSTTDSVNVYSFGIGIRL